MNWILFSLIGYFLYALVTVINKFLLRQKAITQPVVFTFWLAILSIFAFALAPFGLKWPGFGAFAFDVLVGFVFFIALIYFYKSLDVNEASRSASFIGAFQPIAVLVLAYLFLSERLGAAQLISFACLVLGGLMISLKLEKGVLREALKGLRFVVLAIIFGAVYWVLAKHMFDSQGFVTGFVWSRVGLVLSALLVLFCRPWRKQVFSSVRAATGGISALMVFGKLLAGFGSLFVHLALSWGSASLVQAMQGSEYAFLVVLTFFLSKKFPKILQEKSSRLILIQKIIAVLFIGGGLAILAF